MPKPIRIPPITVEASHYWGFSQYPIHENQEVELLQAHSQAIRDIIVDCLTKMARWNGNHPLNVERMEFFIEGDGYELKFKAEELVPQEAAGA